MGLGFLTLCNQLSVSVHVSDFVEEDGCLWKRVCVYLVCVCRKVFVEESLCVFGVCVEESVCGGEFVCMWCVCGGKCRGEFVYLVCVWRKVFVEESLCVCVCGVECVVVTCVCTFLEESLCFWRRVCV
ncbi:hypothetical protein BaRGS_00006178 [Batillaria attramentaria]|uniref:Uncharacterized protein n=1 Tax=Batillaria attramentaria TaxID=370345 RepID=A0ABD0LTU0_9CAEN